MSKLIIVEGNSNDKDNVRAIMVKGERGYSAYELYVQNGGTLTEEEWLDEFLNADNFYNKSETDNLLDDKVNKTDIVDNVTSTNIDKPLSANQGKELKDLIDDTYTKSETDNLLDDKADATDLANYKLSGDFALITGSFSASASDNPGSSWKQTQENINYPTGFTNTNCVCIAFGITKTDKENEYKYDSGENVASVSTGMASGNLPRVVDLKEENINIRVYNYGGSSITVYYKIVLMKIS